jgi:hypothetical protein
VTVERRKRRKEEGQVKKLQLVDNLIEEDHKTSHTPIAIALSPRSPLPLTLRAISLPSQSLRKILQHSHPWVLHDDLQREGERSEVGQKEREREKERERDRERDRQRERVSSLLT